MTVPTSVAEVAVLTAAHDPFNPADPIDLTSVDGALYFESAAQLVVYYIALAGTVTLLELGTDYEIAGEGIDGEGTITPTFDFAEALGTLHVSRATPMLQEAAYEENDGFPAAVQEGVEDRNRLIDQDLNAQVVRSLRVPRYEDPVPVLPAKADRIGKYLRGKADGSFEFVEGLGYTDEEARDAIGAALVAGAGIAIVVNDGADTITISSTGSYTDEEAQDAVGSILSDSGDIDFTYDDGAPSISAVVKNDAITFAKMQDIATARLLGRSTAGSGNIEEITIGSGLSLAGGELSATGGGGGAFYGAHVKKAADQTSANYSSETVVTWDAEVHDVGGWHDNAVNPERLTVPAGANAAGHNYFEFEAQIRVSLTTASTHRSIYLRQNAGSTIIGTHEGHDTGATNWAGTARSDARAMVDGDYVVVRYDEESDTSITVSAADSRFTARSLGT
jgi:hypothetical protein